MKHMHEKKTILKEVKNLSLALISKQDKLTATLDKLKDEKRKQKRAKKLTVKKGDEISFLKKRIGDLKRNEEMLLGDLTAQQKCANDAIKSLENLTVRMEEDKQQVRQEVDVKYQELMLKEKEKFEIKTKYLTTMNESLNDRMKEAQARQQQDQLHIDRLTQEAQSKDLQIAGLTQERDQLRPLLEKQRAEAEAQADRANRAQKALTDAEDRIRGEFEDQVDDKARELRVKQEEINAATKEISLLDSQMTSLKHQNQGLNDKVEQLQRELFDAKSKLDN